MRILIRERHQGQQYSFSEWDLQVLSITILEDLRLIIKSYFLQLMVMIEETSLFEASPTMIFSLPIMPIIL